MEQHINFLTRELGIEVETKGCIRQSMCKYILHPPAVSRSIKVPPIINELTYFSALHEIGHIILMDNGVFPDPNRKVLHEALAWRWAFENSIVKPSKFTLKVAGICMLSYDSGIKADEKWRKLLK